MSEKINISAKIPSKLSKKLDKYQKKYGVSKSEFIRNAIVSYINLLNLDLKSSDIESIEQLEFKINYLKNIKKTEAPKEEKPKNQEKNNTEIVEKIDFSFNEKKDENLTNLGF